MFKRIPSPFLMFSRMFSHAYWLCTNFHIDKQTNRVKEYQGRHID